MMASVPPPLQADADVADDPTMDALIGLMGWLAHYPPALWWFLQIWRAAPRPAR